LSIDDITPSTDGMPNDHNLLKQILEAVLDQGKQLKEINERLDKLDNTVVSVEEQMERLQKSQLSLEANMTLLQRSYHSFGSQIGLITQHCAQRGDAIQTMLNTIECTPPEMRRKKTPTEEMPPNGNKDGA